MTVLKRDDGISFILHVYREYLEVTSRSVLKSEIRLLAKQHGNYICLNKLNPEQWDVACAHEPGYLLAETIWHYLNKPANLIYCETFSEQILLVIVINNNISVVDIIPDNELYNELISFTTEIEDEVYYRVVMTDDIAKTINKKNYGKLSEKIIDSIECLPESLLLGLPGLPEYFLHPVEKVLRSKILIRSRILKLVLPIILLPFLLTWLFFSVQTKQKLAHNVVVTNDLPAYRALMSPAPAKQLKELHNILSIFNVIKGWQAQQIDFDGHAYKISMLRQDGDIDWLTNWGRKNHYQLRLTSYGAEMIISSKLMDRPKPKNVFPVQEILVSTVNQLNQLKTEKIVKLGKMTEDGNAQKIILSISLHNLTLPTLKSLQKIFSGNESTQINFLQINRLHSGCWNGKIELAIWGS